MERDPSKPTSHNPVLDGLRGVAILMVLFTHSMQDKGGTLIARIGSQGQFGVELFFVVSAFTLMMASDERGGLELAPFAIRRWARIAPLYFVGIAFYLAFPAPIPNHAPTLGRIAENVALLQGIFPLARNSVVPGGWSVGCEVLFYALFPVIFRYVTSFPRALGLVALAWATTLVFIRLSPHFGWPKTVDSPLYYGILFQCSSFAIGIAAYRFVAGLKPIEARWRLPLSDLALAFFGAVMWYGIEVFYNLAAFLGVTLCLGGFVVASALGRPTLLTSKPLVRLGLDSYSVYVWHWAVLFGLVIPHLPNVGGPAVTVTTRVLGTLGIAWPISALSRRYIEVPGIELGRRCVRRARRTPVTA